MVQSKKNFNSNRIVIIAAVAATVILIAAGVIIKLNYDAKNVVAVVNGEVISKDDLYQKMFEKTGREALSDLIDKVLLFQEAEAQGVKITDAELDEEIDRLIEEEYGSMDNFYSVLYYYAMSEEQFREEWRVYMIARKLLASEIEPTDEEVFKYFDTHQEELAEPESVYVSHIVLKTQEHAEEVLNRLKDGADFADTASLESVDVASKVRGGDLGWFFRGQLDPTIEELLFSLELGQPSHVISTDLGYTIYMVSDRRDPRDVTLDEVYVQIREDIADSKFQNAYYELIDRLWLEADIDYSE